MLPGNMSEHINYSFEKFSRATRELAISADAIQNRLTRAADYLQILYDSHIPETMQDEFADLMTRLNDADFSELTDEQAVKFAEQIVDFTISLHSWQVWDARRK
jgi:hypothetical protein